MTPGAPFALESPAVVVAPPNGPKPWPAYVWFRFTCGNAGTTHNDAATITCLETGDVFNVSLSGNCVPRPTVAVQLVFDQSGSMLDITDEGRRKEQVLRVLGPPDYGASVYFKARDELVWDWRYCDVFGRPARFLVLFDGTSGATRSTMTQLEAFGHTRYRGHCSR